MKSRSKIGNRKGSPAYRTPSSFRSRQDLSIQAIKAKKNSRLDFKGN